MPNTSNNFANKPIESASITPILRYTGRCIEGLWLIATIFVPLIFFGREYAISEAATSNIEIPKVALIRVISGLIAIIWAIEFSLKNISVHSSQYGLAAIDAGKWYSLFTSPSLLIGWLNFRPTRWFILVAGIFFGSTLLSTALSESFNTSMWGEIPGQDGYSAYTMAAYAILFGVIATHLKTYAQLSRILGAVVLTGTIIGVYGIFQHCGQDFLNILESTGGGSARVTIFMGNAIFAAAVLSMTIPLTLVAVCLHLKISDSKLLPELPLIRSALQDWILAVPWALILSAQILGLIFTFSRGPWAGTALAVLIFLSFIGIITGWRMFIRLGLVFGLACLFSISFLQYQRDMSILNFGSWLGIVIAVTGPMIVFSILLLIRKSGQAILWVGVVGTIIAVVGSIALIGPSLSLSNNNEVIPSLNAADSTSEQVFHKVSSIAPETLSGFSEGRGTHWKVSWDLITERPWFNFDDINLAWIRPFIGYGPDLFRYTYLLGSTSDEHRFAPLEPDHAHNYFIHQTVEQGFIGGIASLSLFIAIIAIVGQHFLRNRISSNLYKILLLGLGAIVIGRFLEMMVGVARISDLTILWVIFGLFAAIWNFDKDSGFSNPDNEERQKGAELSLSLPPATPSIRGISIFGYFPVIRIGILIFLTIGITILTWTHSIHPVRASISAGTALNHFKNGELINSVKEFDNAINLAPAIPYYHNNKSQVFRAYELSNYYTEPECANQSITSYSRCLSLKRLKANHEAVENQPLYYRSRLALGDTYLDLEMYEQARREYIDGVALVPNSYQIRNKLAEIYLMEGHYEHSLYELEQSIMVTGTSIESSEALFLKGQALIGLGKLPEAETALLKGLSLRQDSPLTDDSLYYIRAINAAMGTRLHPEHFDAYIDQNPADAGATYLRGLAHMALGNTKTAVSDIRTSISFGLNSSDVQANFGYSLLKNGISGEINELAKVVSEKPSNPRYNAYYSEYLTSRRNFDQAIRYAEKAVSLDPELGLAHFVKGKALFLSGSRQVSIASFDTAATLKLPSALHYGELGEFYSKLGDQQLAISSINKAIQINPEQSNFYSARGTSYMNLGDFRSALNDFDTAIRLDPLDGEYLIRRGVLHSVTGDIEAAISDLTQATMISPSDTRIKTAIKHFNLLKYAAELINITDGVQSLRGTESSTHHQNLVGYYEVIIRDYIYISKDLFEYSNFKISSDIFPSTHPLHIVINSIVHLYKKNPHSHDFTTFAE